MSPLDEILGDDPALAAVRDSVRRLLQPQDRSARRLPPILILGETGTGKGLLANAIHRAGPRASGPFVDVNCAAIPETLLEAELFGYERGAFTDARHAKPGLFQAAHGGSFFLDEIGLLPQGLQAKVLKALEERVVRRLGSTRSEPIDVWVLAATSEDLEEAVRARRFREDLYHRLAVVTLTLPPLRERTDDVLMLAEHFLARACVDYGLAPKIIGAEARQALREHAWPGNVRELGNVMERAALLADASTLTPVVLGLRRAENNRGRTVDDERRALADADAAAEQARILESLRITKWNISRAAARLGMPRNTLRYRMEKLGLAQTATTRAEQTGPSPGGTVPAAPVETTTAPSASPPVSEPAAPEPLEPRAPLVVRWEPRRVAFLAIQLAVGREQTALSDGSRVLIDVLDKVHSFGGQVHALSATRVIAAFGFDGVDDPARLAAHAAMTIEKVTARGALDDPMRHVVTVALHTERLPVCRIGERMEIDADAAGPAHAVLAALVGHAEPGTVVTSSQAAVFLSRRFALVPGGVAAGTTGKVYRLTGAAPGSRPLAGFVGRETELTVLRDCFLRADSGQGQVVTIVGEPGIGKTRLLQEFRQRVAGSAMWMEGQAISFGRTMAFHPLIDLLRRTCGIDEADPEPAAADKIERVFLRLRDDLAPALRFVRYLLSVDPGDPDVLRMDPQLRLAGIFEAMRRIVAAAAQDRPLVIVWEDLHWADRATEELVARLADGLAAQQVLMIVTGRPGYAPPAHDRTVHTRLALTALSKSDSIAMARSLLLIDELPEAIELLLARRAEGNPFFVEELLRSVQETVAIRREGDRLVLPPGLDALVLPDTMQEVVLARIDRLGADSRHILDVASVVGREFGRPLVERFVSSPEAADKALRELVALELIQERAVFPECTYAFTHAVTHEVAYEALRPERRAELHHRIGDTLEALHADRLAEHAEVLALHFSTAGEWLKAREYLLQAARKAADTFAIREALALYDQALEATQRAEGSPDLASVLEIRRARSTLYFVMSEFDRARAEAESVVGLTRQLGDPVSEAKALARIGWAATWQRDLEGAVTYAREAIGVAGPIGGHDVLARAYFTIGFVRAGAGDLNEARDAIDRALAFGRSSGSTAYRSLALSVSGLLKSWEGEYVGAAEVQAEGLRLAREHHLLVPLLFNYLNYGLTLTGHGEYQAAFALFREGLTLAEKVGDEVIHHSRLLNSLGWLHFELGDLDRALDLNRRSAEVGRRQNDPGTFANAEINLGDIFLAKGDLDQAAEFFGSAYRFQDNPATNPWMRWRYSMRLYASLGELWLRRGDLARAREFADRCLDLATRTNARKNLVKGWRLRGQISLAHREFDEAGSAMQQALTLASRVGNPTQLWQTHVAWGRLCAARHRHDDADVAYGTARAVLERVKAGLRDPALRAGLERFAGLDTGADVS